MDCKFCNSPNTIKEGVRNKKQDYLCKDCGHKFVDNLSFVGMRTPAAIIGNSIHMFYDGVAMNTVDEQMKVIYDYKINTSSIWRWVMKYSKRAYDYLSHYPAELGDTWLVDKTKIKIRGQPAWDWDVIDVKTRVLVGTHL